MASSLEDRLTAVYRSSRDQVELDRVYNEWAEDYERDIWSSGNPKLAIIVGLVERYVRDRTARILDGGCGPGMLAGLLSLLGYHNIVGCDASEGMLAMAEKKGCYSELSKKLISAEIDYPDESFDAVIVTGVLTKGHAPPEAFDGLLRISRPGAPIIISKSKPSKEDGGYLEKMQALVDEGAWRLQEDIAPFRSFPFLEHHREMLHWVGVYRKT